MGFLGAGLAVGRDHGRSGVRKKERLVPYLLGALAFFYPGLA